MRTVFRVRVITKDMVTDLFANLKSLVGGRIKSYEQLIQKNLEEMEKELREEFPDIKNIRMSTTEMIRDGAELILFGETECKEKIY